jgi:hypothetical protein
MTGERFAVVQTEYTVEAVAVIAAPTPHEEAPSLNWRRIGQGAALGAVLGILISGTAGDLNSVVLFVAGTVTVAAAFGILGGLWGSVFFSPEEE